MPAIKSPRPPLHTDFWDEENRRISPAWSRWLSQAQTSYADNIVPTGAVDGVNKVFNLPQAPNPQSSLKLFKTGTRMTAGTDYTLNAATITFTVAPAINSTLQADYRFVPQG